MKEVVIIVGLVLIISCAPIVIGIIMIKLGVM